MAKSVFKCNLITPMFMAGADGRTPELRAPSLKGMMRFWWRAIRGEDRYEELKKKEDEIFGGVGKGEGKSPVRMKIGCSNLEQRNSLKAHYNFDWRYDKQKGQLTGPDAGIGYLLYSTILRKKERVFFQEKGTFSIALSSRQDHSFNHALAALWASIYLGGLGTRARRGGGNITVRKVSKEELSIPFLLDKDSSKEIAEWLREGFRKVSEIIREKRTTQFACSYSNLGFSRFVLAKEGKRSWQEALNEVGKSYKEFRYKHRKELFKTAAFGLPVRHRNGTVKGTKKEERRSSPLIFKILESRGRFYWMVLRLSGEFLPRGSALQLDGRTQKPDYALIDEFWKELKELGDEHILSKPKVLDDVVEKIKQLNPEKILLFGSKARGDARKNSDIDLVVVGEAPVESIEVNGPFDIVSLRKASPELKDKIESEGVVLYERKD